MLRTTLATFAAALCLLCPGLSPADSQGARATASGAAFEDQITHTLEQAGFRVEPHEDYGGSLHENAVRGGEDRIALRQPPFTTLFGTPGRCDFVLVGKTREDDVWIETKRMAVPGSLDEKIPHMFLNALTAIPGHRVIILIDGDGWRPGALAWLRAQTKDRRWHDFANYPGKRVDVMTQEEFKQWLTAYP